MTDKIIDQSSIIINDKIESCIFCLEEYQPLIIYDSQCSCHPVLHAKCIDEWNKLKPHTCPICLTKYNMIIIEPRTNKCSLKICYKFFCVICCCSLCFSPLIFASLLISLFSSNQIFTNRYNSTKVL
jgi:hypothetical protein